jgi:hypothetical protein
MPKGPNGEKRPADVVGCAVLIGRIATGQAEESPAPTSGRRRSGLAGAKARAEKLTTEERAKIAKMAAEARWR